MEGKEGETTLAAVKPAKLPRKC